MDKRSKFTLDQKLEIARKCLEGKSGVSEAA